VEQKSQLKMIVNIHMSEGRIILAICDNNLVGKKFSENDLQLDLSSNFYKGKEMDIDKLRGLVKKAYMINAVGSDSVTFLIKEGIIEKKNIIKVKNIPHAQYVLLNL
jgi:uncharacterized protein